jgi:hypothetical protein
MSYCSFGSSLGEGVAVKALVARDISGAQKRWDRHCVLKGRHAGTQQKVTLQGVFCGGNDLVHL